MEEYPLAFGKNRKSEHTWNAYGEDKTFEKSNGEDKTIETSGTQRKRLRSLHTGSTIEKRREERTEKRLREKKTRNEQNPRIPENPSKVPNLFIQPWLRNLGLVWKFLKDSKFQRRVKKSEDSKFQGGSENFGGLRSFCGALRTGAYYLGEALWVEVERYGWQFEML